MVHVDVQIYIQTYIQMYVNIKNVQIHIELETNFTNLKFRKTD